MTIEESTGEKQSDAAWPAEPYTDRNDLVLNIRTESDNQLGKVRAVISRTYDELATGLSKVESLPSGAGMLFVYDSHTERVFSMNGMKFGIDIIFANSDGEITEIHHAPAPDPDEDGSNQHYPGHGRYALEVGYRWTEQQGISIGDFIHVPR